MDWLSLRETLPKIEELPDRAYRLTCFERVLDGTHYDELQHPFSKEISENGEYIPLSKRRPSVRTNLARVVVEDAVSLLFSEGHWPPIRAAQDRTMKLLTAMVAQVRLNETMLEAAIRGSVGSVAIQFRVLKRKPFFDVMPTAFLTPTWQADAPDVLANVVELYQTSGRTLRETGYTIPNDDLNSKFWFRRMWDDDREIWYVPEKLNPQVNVADIAWKEDAKRTVRHGLAFVPMIWVRNLPTSRRQSICDGACTFEAAIDTVIEADYLLSQGGRALKYAADPTLVIKQGTLGEADTTRKGGAANALEVDVDGDAKLLEINGTAAAAVMQHVTQLRGIALEAIHGNRANADRLSAATSGRSIELMMSGLIALADRLRISYGEGALMEILRMVCAASKVVAGGLIIGDEQAATDIDDAKLELRWPSWLPSMPRDVLEGAQALVTAFLEGIVSRETAVARFGSLINVSDAGEEFDRVLADIQEQRAEDDRTAKRDADLATSTAVASAGAKTAQTVKKKANAGPTVTRNATA